MNQQEQMREEMEIKEENLVQEPDNLGPFRIINQNWDQQRDFPKCCNWTLQQNAKYAAFIIKYSSFLYGKSYSRVWAVFKTMSKFIKSRNFRQCKQHHQRMCDKFQDLDNIILHLDKSSQQFVDMLQEQTVALNQHIQNLIKQVKSVGKKKAQKVEDPEHMDFQKQKNKPTKMASQNYPLFLTLQLQPRKQQKQLSFQQQQTICKNLFNKWSCKLHLIQNLTTL